MKGIRLIISALNVFNKIVEKLQRGIAYCNDSIAENDEKIDGYKSDNAQMKVEVEKARRVIEKLKNITA